MLQLILLPVSDSHSCDGSGNGRLSAARPRDDRWSVRASPHHNCHPGQARVEAPILCSASVPARDPGPSTTCGSHPSHDRGPHLAPPPHPSILQPPHTQVTGDAGRTPMCHPRACARLGKFCAHSLPSDPAKHFQPRSVSARRHASDGDAGAGQQPRGGMTRPRRPGGLPREPCGSPDLTVQGLPCGTRVWRFWVGAVKGFARTANPGPCVMSYIPLRTCAADPIAGDDAGHGLTGYVTSRISGCRFASRPSGRHSPLPCANRIDHSPSWQEVHPACAYPGARG
jgi:hypothetical protein